ncbi:MAG: efflux RND transporter periplasmic adaptor subunit, partial [Gammaproteobacteria bacterium]|nr:efflux RND transporter periplasmic adaptor subunit [Gammaproteobacteria bacterium]
MKIVVKFFACLFLLAVTTFQAVNAAKGPPGGRQVPVVVAEVVDKLLSPTILVPGTVISRQEAALPTEVSGKLTWVAEVGTEVAVGQPLARIDDTLAQLRAKETNANLAREQSRLSFLEKDQKRLQALIKSSHATRNEYERRQMERDVAVSEVALMQAKVKLDNETLSRFTVRAPFDGVVTSRSRREGEWIGSGETVVTFANPKSLEIVARVSEKSVVNLSKGQRLVVHRGDVQRLGQVKAVVPIGEKQSLLYDVRIETSDKGWLAGQTVRVSVPVGTPRRVLAVPRDALVLRRTGTSLFVIDAEGKSKRVDVQTGIAGGDLIEVVGKLQPGDKVVTRGSERLRPG